MDDVLLMVQNQKERSYAWILMLQLVTSELGAIAIPKAQLMQSLPYLGGVLTHLGC
jgi:hypothetical protein